MSIKYAVLGLIAEESRHGYAVRTAFEQRLGDFWELNYGQVYQVLTSLEGEGLICGTHEQIGRRPPRTVYAITAKGRGALRTWLAQPLSVTRPFRDDFYVRLLFLKEDSGVALPELLKARLDACEHRLAELLDQRQVQERGNTDKLTRWLFTEAAVMHAEADLKAAELCRKVLAADKAAQPAVRQPVVERLRHSRGGA